MLKDYYLFIKSQPCLACHASPPSEAAHIHSLYNPKIPSEPLKRGHKGVAAYGAIPLCKRCHLDIHRHSEREWLDAHVKGGYEASLRYIIRALAILIEHSK